MFNYQNLEPHQFEELCRDIMQVRTGTQLHVFPRGRDGGVDLTDDSHKHDIVVQVKHYEKSGFTALRNNLEKEIEKVKKLNPKQYYVCVSQSLTDANVNTIYKMFSDYMESTSNIMTLDDIDSFLHDPKNLHITRKHIALWLESGITIQLLLEYFSSLMKENDNDAFQPTTNDNNNSVVDNDMPTVFISYSSNQSDYVDVLESALQNDARIIRYTHQDSTGVGTWKSFRSFMNTIRDQDFAVLIISKDYLESEACIYEVMQLWKDEKSWDDKVMYIVTDDVNIYNPFGRVTIVKYWQSVFDRYIKEVSDISIPNSVSISNQANLYQMYAANIGAFLDKVADSYNPKTEDAIDKIRERLKAKK